MPQAQKKVAVATPSAHELRAARKKARERFLWGRRAETSYARSLRSVARQVEEILRGLVHETNLAATAAAARQALQKYSELLTPWARAVAQRMTQEVAERDAAAWSRHGKSMGRALRKEIETAPTGEATLHALNEQVNLITSLPREAAEKVHELTVNGITRGLRAEELAEKIRGLGKVTESRATLIARTEVTRTAGALTMARARYVGAEGYIWRTAKDSEVRPLHRKLEGKFINFDDPPVAGENGERAHAGMIYNCRCFMEPVLPDVIA